jgi:hypothetical protein
MTWIITYYSKSVQEEILAMSAGFLGRYLRYSDRMEMVQILVCHILERWETAFLNCD